MPSTAPERPAGSPAPTDGDHRAAPSRRRSVMVGLGIAAFAVMGIFWALIFTGFFNWRNPDELHDKAWTASAEQICKPMQAFIDDLPRAQTAKTPEERAVAVDRGTGSVEDMVARLEARLPDNAGDRDVVRGWLADWHTYVADRRDFTRRLRADPKAKPLFTEVHGGWSTDAIDAFANANGIPACSSPEDL